MRVLGWRRVKIENLGLDGEFKARLQRPHVLERAKSVKRVGILSEPGIRGKGNRVLYGRDRIAAACIAGETDILCKVYECTDEEAAEIEASENYHRRHEPEKARAEMLKILEMYEGQVHKLLDTNPEQAVSMAGGNRSGAKTARGLARARLAAERGVKPDSVRKAEYRANNAATWRKMRLERKNSPPAPEAEIATIGMTLETEFIRQTNAVRSHLNVAHQSAQQVQRYLRMIETEKLPFPPATLQRMHDDAHALCAALKRALPTSLCPYCKGLPGVVETCAACLQAGWIDAPRTEHVPKELWQEGDKMMVVHNGRLVDVADMLETPATPEPYVERDAEDVQDLFA